MTVDVVVVLVVGVVLITVVVATTPNMKTTWETVLPQMNLFHSNLFFF